MQLALSRVTYTHPAAQDPILNNVTIAFPQGWTGLPSRRAGPAFWATTAAESPRSPKSPAASWSPTRERSRATCSPLTAPRMRTRRPSTSRTSRSTSVERPATFARGCVSGCGRGAHRPRGLRARLRSRGPRPSLAAASHRRHAVALGRAELRRAQEVADRMLALATPRRARHRRAHQPS